MDTVKTFFKNAAKAPGEEREAYTQPSTSDVQSTDMNESDKVPSSKTASTSAKTSSSSSADATYDTETTTAAPVVHKHIHHKTIDENQKIIDRDHDVDHYTKKIQPIQVTRSQGIAHVDGTHKDESRSIDKENSKALKKSLDQDQKDLVSTTDVSESHESVNLDNVVNDRTHHHVHEEIVPVIEEDEYATDVKRNTTHIKERIHEQGQVEKREVLPTKKVSEKEAKQMGV